jgi:hypothetical protein
MIAEIITPTLTLPLKGEGRKPIFWGQIFLERNSSLALARNHALPTAI